MDSSICATLGMCGAYRLSVGMQARTRVAATSNLTRRARRSGATRIRASRDSAHAGHSHAEAIFGIHIQHADRRPANCGQVGKKASIPCEVFLPRLNARMEKLDDLRGVGIDPGQVRALVQIARDAGEGEVCKVITAAVLFRHDVFDLELGDR